MKKKTPKAADPPLILKDAEGRIRVICSADLGDGCPRVSLCDDTGCERLIMGIRSNGSPFVSLCRQNGEAIGGFGEDTEGRVCASLSGLQGEIAFFAAVHPDGIRHLEIRDSNGKVVWQARYTE
jgi:hypothetical protein